MKPTSTSKVSVIHGGLFYVFFAEISLLRKKMPVLPRVYAENRKEPYGIKKGKTSKLKPKLSPSNSDDKISYSSSNKKVATVNSKGIITAKKKGKTIITVKSGKKTVRCKIRVK